MKTKFDSVVKLRKNEIEKVQRDLQKLNGSIKNLQNKIENLYTKFSSFSIPQNGSFKEFQQIKTLQDAIKMEIDNLKNQIITLENRKQELLEEYKKANIEYEKIKYLQKLEIEKQKKKLKQKESLQMDEIAIMLSEPPT